MLETMAATTSTENSTKRKIEKTLAALVTTFSDNEYYKFKTADTNVSVKVTTPYHHILLSCLLNG